ncbi:MAG: hypothetical protein K2N38_14395 [Oscillospiraceae bacterium]|nr:hypothetical protein [Oscillospiraceae bacterium]
MKEWFTHNIKNKIIALIIGAIIFGGLQVLSMTALKDVYLFDWLGRRLYCYVWIPVIWFTLFNKLAVSYSITLGNLAATITGELLGGYIRGIRMERITPETPSDQVYFLSGHDGVFIWAAVLAVCVVVGIIIEWIIGKRKKRVEKNAKT